METEKVIKEVNLRNRQREVDKLYEKDGLTDEVLDLQLAINQERHEHDITDNNERIYKEYVQ